MQLGAFQMRWNESTLLHKAYFGQELAVEAT